jgi:hypothetical protein
MLMKRFLQMSLPLIALLGATPQAEASSEFRDVVQATRSIIAGRCFQNDDLTRMAFGSLASISHLQADMEVEISFGDGQSAYHRESIKNNGNQATVEQLVNGKLLGKYLVSR